MACWYCNDKDEYQMVAGKKACKLCFRDFYFDPEIDYDDGDDLDEI
jgi:hypothetical protein